MLNTEYQKLYQKMLWQEIIKDAFTKLSSGELSPQDLLDDANQDCVIIICIALLQKECFPELLQFLNLIQENPTKLANIYYKTIYKLIEINQHILIKKMLDLMPKNHITHIFNIFAYGCSLHRQRNFDQALEIFNFFYKKTIAPFIKIRSFNSQLIFCGHYITMIDVFMTRILERLVSSRRWGSNYQLNVCRANAKLLGTQADVIRRFKRYQNQRSFHNFQLITQKLDPKHLPADAPIFFTAADGKYLEWFLADWVQSIAQSYPQAMFHIGIINPSADIISQTLETLQKYPNCQIDISGIDTKYTTATAYAAGRFYILEHLIPHYRHKIICLDIDLTFKNTTKPMLETLPESDLALLYMDKPIEPLYSYMAGLIQLNQDSLNFIHYLLCFIEEKIHLPPSISWMLDQAAFYSVINYFRENNPDFKIFEITTEFLYLFGVPDLDFVATTKFTQRPF